MRYSMRLTGGLTILPMLLMLSACSSSGQSNGGVARIDGAQVAETPAKSADESNLRSPTSSESAVEEPKAVDNISETELTDEEIATTFTECVRGHGFNIPDPVLNADGTVDIQALRSSVWNDPMFQTRDRAVLGECAPLLQGATFAQTRSQEDMIEIQDNLLDFARCLRDNGVDVPDPDFSSGPRAAMRPLVQGLIGADSRVQTIVEQCTQASFGASDSNRAGRALPARRGGSRQVGD